MVHHIDRVWIKALNLCWEDKGLQKIKRQKINEFGWTVGAGNIHLTQG